DTSASTSVTDAPFSGLVICVSGLSKDNDNVELTEARKQVMEGTLRLGVKLDELPYTVWTTPTPREWDKDACVSINQKQKQKQFPQNQLHSDINKVSGHSIFIDLDVSAQLRCKVVDVATREGAVLVDQWFVGCGASYVVCEGSSIQRYLGHCDNIVSPMWVLKTSKERYMQRFVGLSADLARYVGAMLENLQHVTARQDACKENCNDHIPICDRSKLSQEERLQVANLAKCGIRSRRARRLQSCQVPLRPINPSSLLDSICWSISEPTSRASVYADSLTSKKNFEMHKHGLSVGGDHVESEASFSNLLRPLTESEENELVFKNHFITILYPVDRFAELGPSSRTYFSDAGFTCLQLLEFIYAFYQASIAASFSSVDSGHDRDIAAPQ
uniref:BRCT domain-containing protein n=1 Tax=Chenopodium quinoa TaxID=63459 RepID=A0A803LXS6_CHEQI